MPTASTNSKQAVTKNISMPPQLVELIERACTLTGVSFSEFLRQAATEKLERLGLIIVKQEVS